MIARVGAILAPALLWEEQLTTDRLDVLIDSVGYLRGRVESILAGQDAAERSRKVLYDKLEEANDRVTVVQASVTPVLETVQRITPIVDKLNSDRQRFGGFLFAISLLMGGIGFIMHGVIDWLLKIFTRG